jgi:3-methyladenine DNA glycosylase AlkD
MTPRQLARRAHAALKEAADPRTEARQRSYFRPWETVHIYGVATPGVRLIERRLYQVVRKEWGYVDVVAFCDFMIADRYMESKSLGMTLLARYHRQFEQTLLRDAKRWLAADLCDNWAATDQLATQIISSLLDKFPGVAAAVESWNASRNLWLRRASAVSFVKPAGKGRHLDHAYRTVTKLLPDPHDLIHKASGWLLREAGKADAVRLEKYLLEHGPAIPRTTVRYAIERFPATKRLIILQKTRDAGVAPGIHTRKGEADR